MNNKANELIPELRFPEFAKDGEWKYSRIEDYIELFSGIPLTSEEISDDKSGMPILRGINITEGSIRHSKEIDRYYSGNFETIKKFLVKENDIVISMDGSKVGKNVALVKKEDENAILIQRVARIRQNNKANIFYIYQHILSEKFQRYVDTVNTSSGIPHISSQQIKDFRIAFSSLKEQQKIASCLSSLDEVIAAHSQKLEALKDHKKGLMQNLFPQEGETVPKYRFPEFLEDGEWDNLTLGEISKITSGGTPNRSSSEFWNGNIPWVSTTLINFNTINQANEFITEVGLQNSSANIFPKNTILMAMYGQGKTRGKVAVLGIEAATNQACAAIILKKGYITDYVFQYLAAHYDDIRELSNQGGQENLSGGLIEKIQISIPRPKEQQKIAECLSSLDELIMAQTEKIEQLKFHKKGLMQALFPKTDN